MILMLLFIFIPLVFMTAFTPYITRTTESFGVGIPSEMYDNEVFAGFRKGFKLKAIVFGTIVVAILTILYFFISEEVWGVLYGSFIFLYIVGTFMLYLQYHNKTKKFKAEQNWAETKRQVITVDTAFSGQKKTYSQAWFLIPFSITLATAIYSFVNYDRFPESLPMQYNFEGNVINWAEKSIGTIFMFPLLQLFMTGLFVFINYIINNSKQQVDPANPELSIMQNRTFRRRWSLFTILSGTILVSLFTLTPISFIYPMNSNLLFMLTMITVGIIVIGAFVLSIVTGQGGSRLTISAKKSSDKIERDDDSYWKLGVFYFNPNDPALFVEKRFGSGWTSNFARPLSWVILFGIFGIIILIASLA